MLALALVLASCGGGGEQAATATTTTTVASPPASSAGRRVFERSGCLACHQLGMEGNSGPGNNLAGLGTRRSPAEIRRSLVDAPSPMPSFRQLGRERLGDLVAYLSSLRGVAGCPDESDCG